MYLCTLFPFETSEAQNTVVEASVSFHYGNNEVRITLKNGTVLHVAVERLKTLAWLSLLVHDTVRLTCLVNVSHTFSQPYAIRVDALSQAFNVPLWSPQIMALEKNLADAMRYGYVTESTKRKPAWDSFSKVSEIATSVGVAPNVHWSYEDMCFVMSPREPLKTMITPVALVSTVTNHWRAGLLTQWASKGSLKKRKAEFPDDGRYDASETALVITYDVDEWEAAAKSVEFSCARLDCDMSRDDLAATRVVIATPLQVAQSVALREGLEESILAGARCTVMQARRLAVHVVSENFGNFALPLDFIKFNMMILDSNDGLGILSPAQSSRVVRVIKDSRTKPRGNVLCNQSVTNSVPKWAFPLAMGVSEVLHVAVPKSVLKHYQIVGHLVKATPSEERIVKVFSQRFCPLESSEAILRFAQKSMPIGVVKDLMRSHFQRMQISLASFVSGEPPVAINSAYALRAIDTSTKSCCVCFETASEEKWAITLCGHVFCKECARQQFYKDWSDGRAKDCAVCRTPLLSGDFFLVEAFEKSTYVPVLSAKKQAVRSFVTGVRSSLGIQYWPVSDSSARPKHLIIEDVEKVAAPNIIQRFPQGLQVHVFYGADETRFFRELADSF